jgi:hypothetical protein
MILDALLTIPVPQAAGSGKIGFFIETGYSSDSNFSRKKTKTKADFALADYLAV